MALVEARGLTVRYDEGPAPAVADVSFRLERGTFTALVGGSGSGKSTLGLAVARLTDFLPCRAEGAIFFDGRPVFELGREEIREIRRTRIGYVFQDPGASLNPVFRVGDQIREALRRPVESRFARSRGLVGARRAPLRDPGEGAEVARLLGAVRIREPGRVARSYPHELSGGMKQRAMIAMALAKEPDLLIADEPATALDATVAKEILRLFLDLRAGRDLTVLFITHDLGAALAIADRILIMQGGAIVEEISDPAHPRPAHPYARKLMNCAALSLAPKSFFEV